MKRADYKCEEVDCNYIWEVWLRNKLEDFPLQPNCPKCQSVKTRRLYSDIVVDVAEGKQGNAETGYADNIVYHPSKFGKFKGKKVK